MSLKQYIKKTKINMYLFTLNSQIYCCLNVIALK